jgi:hypothetical protein
MALLGLGVGAVNQNLVLAVQNNAAHSDVGAASSLVVLFRMVGGSVGVSALGTALGHHVAASVVSGLRSLGLTPPTGEQAGAIPDLATLPAPVREVFSSAFADATGQVFLAAAPFALVALVCIAAIREVPLRTTIARADEVAATVPSQPSRAPEAVGA